jgi:hypothetical protein
MSKQWFMDTSGMDEKQKAYVHLCRDQLLVPSIVGDETNNGGFTGGFMGGMGPMG